MEQEVGGSSPLSHPIVTPVNTYSFVQVDRSSSDLLRSSNAISNAIADPKPVPHRSKILCPGTESTAPPLPMCLNRRVRCSIESEARASGDPTRVRCRDTSDLGEPTPRTDSSIPTRRCKHFPRHGARASGRLRVERAGVRLSEHRVQLIGGVGIHARDEVAVDVQGHADIAMPQPFLHDLRRHALYEQHRGMSVA